MNTAAVRRPELIIRIESRNSGRRRWCWPSTPADGPTEAGTCIRAAAGTMKASTPSNGRGKARTWGPAKSCSPPWTPTACRPVSIARSRAPFEARRTSPSSPQAARASPKISSKFWTGAGADAALAASVFHYGTYTVGDLKQFLAQRGVPVRLMIIPCIDLMDGKVVQLVQGRDKALEGDAPLEMLAQIRGIPRNSGDRSRRRDGEGREQALWWSCSPRARAAASAAESAMPTARGG